MKKDDFSFRTRSQALSRFPKEVFDLLIVGGGITGAAVARDAGSRGLKVALVERNDFASGTSSKSSKLIHGGLRYLQNFELALVFEALSERAFLLKTAPHMVRPLPFYLPVYVGDARGKNILSLGLWLYDLLSLFRAPGFHRRLSRKQMLRQIPFLKREGLVGGFRYYDASMWDDVLVTETLRAASRHNTAIANYVEATKPIWQNDRIVGFKVKDRSPISGAGEMEVRARRVVVCAGPWADEMGKMMVRNPSDWQPWLNPSKGVHLVFKLSRVPVPGAMVMSHPDDGRISFVMPRPDLGEGVTIVGTTDSPIKTKPENTHVDPEDVDYLLALLHRYYPSLEITAKDIISAYVGVRPLVKDSAASLQKVSREHSIEFGPGGVVMVAGGKYTTHRKMAEEIVDFALKSWKSEAREGRGDPLPENLIESRTDVPINPATAGDALAQAKLHFRRKRISVPAKLLERYGAELIDLIELDAQIKQDPKLSKLEDPEGFPMLGAQLMHAIHHECVVHLEDFYFRRLPLFLAREDHGLPWAEMLSRIWAREMGLDDQDAKHEVELLKKAIEDRLKSTQGAETPDRKRRG